MVFYNLRVRVSWHPTSSQSGVGALDQTFPRSVLTTRTQHSRLRQLVDGRDAAHPYAQHRLIAPSVVFAATGLVFLTGHELQRHADKERTEAGPRVGLGP